MNAFHNLMQEAEDQWGQSQRHASLALRFMGRAEQTGNEPGDTFCRAPLEAAQRCFDRSAKCSERAAKALAQALAIRPEIEITPAGLAAIEHAKNGAPPSSPPVDGVPPVAPDNVKQFRPRVLASCSSPVRDYPDGDGDGPEAA